MLIMQDLTVYPLNGSIQDPFWIMRYGSSYVYAGSGSEISTILRNIFYKTEKKFIFHPPKESLSDPYRIPLFGPDPDPLNGSKPYPFWIMIYGS